MPTALIVASHRDDRERMGTWIEGAGFEVESCPGPIGPDACLGLRGPRCPLAGAADVIVLDMGGHDDPFGGVVSAWELMNAYLSQGLPVVALAHPGDTLLAEGSAALMIRRPPERDELVDAIRRALRGRARVGPGF